mgnify:CR=1 FL=1
MVILGERVDDASGHGFEGDFRGDGADGRVEAEAALFGSPAVVAAILQGVDFLDFVLAEVGDEDAVIDSVVAHAKGVG